MTLITATIRVSENWSSTFRHCISFKISSKKSNHLKIYNFYSFQKDPPLYNCHFPHGGGETPE